MQNHYSSENSDFSFDSPAKDRGASSSRPARRSSTAGAHATSSRSVSSGPRGASPRKSFSKNFIPKVSKNGNQLERPMGSVYQYGKFRYIGSSASPSDTQARSSAPSPRPTSRPMGRPSTSPRSASGFNFRDGYDNRGGFDGSSSRGFGSDRPSHGGYSARPTSRPNYRPASGSTFGTGARGGFSSGPGNSRGSGFGGRGGSRGGKKGREERINPNLFINRTAPEKTDASGAVILPADLHPIKHTFMDFAMDDRLKRAVIAKGYTVPSPIQDQSIPLILEGRDIVGIANTGTGKTAAFLLPLIHKVLQNKNEQVIVVAPTRELAIQIDQEFKDLSRGMGLFSVCCVGGVNIVGQLKELRYFNNFIIGTPGRLKDLIERGQIKLEKFNTIVLDEADQMLDMGFINDMKYLVAKMPAVRHTLFFSATLSPEIERLIGSFLNNPARVMVKTRDTAKDIDQDVIRIMPGMNKADVLVDLLKQPGFDKVIVFCKTKHGAEKLSNFLIKEGIKAESIHGDKDHRRRQKALTLFKSHHVQTLVATDVAARGLDISGVSHVINFDLPSTYTDYVHRIGRTGRAGKKGMALTFVQG